MKIREIMTTDVGFCGPQTNAAAIAEIIWSRDCGAVPVVDERGVVLGIVTDRDLTIALGTRNRRASTVRADEVMTTDLATCSPEDDVRRALEVMETWKVRRLPVIEADGRLRGIVSIYDIVQASSKKGADIPASAIVKALARFNDRTAPKGEPAIAGRSS